MFFPGFAKKKAPPNLFEYQSAYVRSNISISSQGRFGLFGAVRGATLVCSSRSLPLDVVTGRNFSLPSTGRTGHGLNPSPD
jgi:hypothetical protein